MLLHAITIIKAPLSRLQPVISPHSTLSMMMNHIEPLHQNNNFNSLTMQAELLRRLADCWVRIHGGQQTSTHICTIAIWVMLVINLSTTQSSAYTIITHNGIQVDCLVDKCFLSTWCLTFTTIWLTSSSKRGECPWIAANEFWKWCNPVRGERLCKKLST